MPGSALTHFFPIPAAAETALTVTEWDLPETGGGWLALLAGGAAVVAYVVWLTRKDARAFPWYVAAFLAALRLAVVAALAVILLNPQERTQTIVNRPSRLAVLVDTSSSMRDPERTPTSDTASADKPRSRAEAVTALLADSPAIDRLRKLHEVHLYTFDSTLEPAHVFRQLGESAEKTDAGATDVERAAETEPAKTFDWAAALAPDGPETRLGEAAAELLRSARGPTLAGLVVVSDGNNNAGAGEDGAIALARDPANPVRIATVGVGGLERPANLVVAEVRAPTEVRYNKSLSKQDPFDVVAFVRGDELPKAAITVELLRHPAESAPETAAVVASQEVSLPEDGTPVEVRFPQEPDAAGAFRYVVRAKPAKRVVEYRDDDNARDAVVTFSERNTAVLVIAGGPNRDYRFVTAMLDRSATTDVDVWLQTVEADELVGVSQEGDELLGRFPEAFPERPSAGRIAEGSPTPKTYDVVIAFDADWRKVPAAGRDALVRWVEKQRGGLIVEAGDVFTPFLADASGEMQGILDLYPVVLSNRFLLEMTDADASQPWPVGLTDAGRSAGFLQLAADASEAEGVWKKFAGIYRTFPTRGPKDLAEVYAVFTDPRAAADGTPVLMASQQFGGGRVIYVGSPELWRLRAVGERYFDTFWVKVIREAGQGRLTQGDGPGVFLLDREAYLLGETVRVRAQLSTPQGEPLTGGDVKLFVTDPGGRSLFPAGREVRPEPSQPGIYASSFRAAVPGRYKVELASGGTDARLTTSIEVSLPQLEQLDPRQNRALLVKLAEDTRGSYFTPDQAADGLVALFDASAAQSVPIDERLKTLWDRGWLLYVMVGLLSVEWLTRKLLKLA